MTIVFKLSDNLKESAIKYYEKYMPMKVPPYAIFQVKNYDTVITLYQSGKIMFQGLSADIEASLWTEQERIKNHRYIDISGNNKKNKEKDLYKIPYNIASVGSDEVGTGDYFGPVVVCATYVSKENVNLMIELGVKDSKKLTDDKIKEIAPALAKKIPYVVYVLSNEEYNNLKEEDKNLNKIKAVLHNKALTSLIKKDNIHYDKIVIDEFCSPKNFYQYIDNAVEKIQNVTFITKAEDQVASVGAASIISRYVFLKEMNELSKSLGKPIPLGASSKVDAFAKELVKEKGMDILKHYVKLNFKNTSKITK